MAEIELSALKKQCLDRRIPDRPTLEQEIHRWNENRNQQNKCINWQLTTADARIKLKKLYPIF
jgi:hypothetical protein